MIKIFFISVSLFFLSLTLSSYGQTAGTTTSEVKTDGIKWMTMEEALKANQKEKRKFIIDAYTDWCGWCKKMDKTTFTNPDIVKYINKKFYAVKFNAEQMEDITFDGKVYKHVGGAGRSGYHELAKFLMNGRMSYPTTIYLDENLKNLSPVPGYLTPSQIDPILKYIGEKHYLTTDWQTFSSTYKTTVKD